MLLVYFVASFVAGFVLSFLWGDVTANKLKIGYLANWFGYHVHHSMFGVIGLLLVPVLRTTTLQKVMIVGFSIGILVEHTVNDAFVFLTKVK